ncbi:MAG: phosphate/phosphite/phosphonate ABC transporter substrate-binding protein [Candidatus Brocadiales bacterium]|nr:phosphate/phosphite/phosphonate ABC transporter substrate-binding protein [Candidatus Brocadiales bacterium]
MKKIFFLVLVSVVCLVIGCSSPVTEKPLKMVLVPGTTSAVEQERYTPIVEYLSEQIGRPIELVFVLDYAATVISLKTGDSDFARLGAFSYLIAVDEDAVEIVAREIKKKTGKASYKSLIFAKANSGIKTLEDLNGKTFAFCDVQSASGYLVPQTLLRDVGLNPEKDFSATFLAGSHPAVIEAVKRNVDAGATNDYRWGDALEKGAIKEGEMIVLAESPPIPNPPIVVKKGMDKDLKEKIQNAFLNMPADIAKNAKMSGYIKAVDSDYDFLRKVVKILGLDKK